VGLKIAQDTLTLDPIAMNVVNRVAADTVLDGHLHFEGGLLVQGEIAGQVHVQGRLIIWTGGVAKGRIRVSGDLYLFGRIGTAGGNPHETSVECQGTAYVSKTGVSTGTLMARRLQLYEGADLQGPFKTLKLGDSLPVLHDVQASGPDPSPAQPSPP